METEDKIFARYYTELAEFAGLDRATVRIDALAGRRVATTPRVRNKCRTSETASMLI